ncbi:cytochrome b N-terminal domain-containing protein [Pelagicoccus enzymogenes]|uniref:cytochrome b N-terminal domain-containing protein n=1 Tax=Pelagicoccus enzymogenes TaxID=2773457 RepID=UPI00281166CC|nr:cytochrome b N-terminal domain-containing protein [Pelagicoccus enzymogenes]
MAKVAEQTVSERPQVGVRGQGILSKVDAAWAWLDGFLGRWLPVELNPLAQSGRAINFCLLVAVASGVLMFIWYSPSVQFAYPSLKDIEGRTLGGVVRGVHRYSSDMMMLLLFVHAFRMFVAGKFFGERWLAWVSGIGLMALVWFIGWTGYWLVWDQPAQQVAVESMRFLDALPIFGEPLGRSFLADALVPSLLFFVVFFLHMLLPLGIAIGLVVHLLRLSRVKLLPQWPLGLSLTIGLIVAAIVYPAPLDSAAAMAEKAEAFTVDAWYMAPLALSLRLQSAGLWVAIGGAIGLGALVPWLFGKRRKKESYQAVVEESRCHSCSQCSQDCPYDAITLIPRTDGKNFPSVAWVDPARCVGCGVCNGSCDSAGVGLQWFSTLSEEKRILNTVALARERGGGDWIAFVAGEVDGGIAQYRKQIWEERLAGYEVFVVPTASWVRSSLVEQLLKRGSKGVLVLRDGRAESASRDGGQWVEDRLEQRRSPEFRPKRAGEGGRWKVLDYTSGDTERVVGAAAAFRGGSKSAAGRRRPSFLTGALALIVLMLGILAAAVGPSHLRVTNPASPEPEFVFSFKAFGAYEEVEALSEEEQEKLPIHMRGRSAAKPKRGDVLVTLSLDGEDLGQRRFAAKGVSSDGPAMGQWRLPVVPGQRQVRVEVTRGGEEPLLAWEGTFSARERHVSVLTYEKGEGFVFHGKESDYEKNDG